MPSSEKAMESPAVNGFHSKHITIFLDFKDELLYLFYIF